jgi:hypothetical protein
MRCSISLLVSIALLSCSKNKAEERRAEQPTEVSGGFGLTMECRVLNKDAEQAADRSIVGCLVFNDDGSRFKGQITDAKTEVTSKDKETISVTQISVGSGESGYSFVAEIPAMKPSDAASLKISAKFDGVLETLTSSMSQDAQVCEQDVTYYVRHHSENPSYKNNIMCTKDAPCSQISKAIDLIPELVDCKITIEVGPGTYERDEGKIWLTKSKVFNGGRITIKGQEVQSGEKTTIIKTAGAQWVRALDLSGSKVVTQDDVVFDRLKIICEHPSHNGVWLSGSNATLRNIEIENCKVGARALSGSRIKLGLVTIKNPRESGMIANSSTVTCGGDLKIMGGSGSIPDSAGLRLNDDSLFQTDLSADWLLSKPYCDLQVSGLENGIILKNNSTFNMQDGDTVSISDVNDGIYAYRGSNFNFIQHQGAFPAYYMHLCENPKLDDPLNQDKIDDEIKQKKSFICPIYNRLRDNPAKLSVKDFRAVGVRLARDALVSDGHIFLLDLAIDPSKEYDCPKYPDPKPEDKEPPPPVPLDAEVYINSLTLKREEVPNSNSKCRYSAKKTVIELHGKKPSGTETIPGSSFMHADAATLALRFSSLELCGGRLQGVWPEPVGEYAFGAVNGALMFLAWDKSPFFTGCGAGETKSNDTVAKHVQAFTESFSPQASVTGQGELCPLNYVKSGDLCYGRLGYFYHHPLRHPNLTSYLGVLAGESRVDLLPFDPVVSSTLPSVVAGGSKVTIVGQWFMKDATVRVGGLPCSSPEVNDAGTKITCVLPSYTAPASSRAILVTNPGTGKTSAASAMSITY